MRGIRFLGNNECEVIDYPDEEPEPGYVMLKMRSSGMCGSDLHRYRAPLPDDEAKRDPVRPGHEPCGEVAAIGEGVKGLQIGDRILQHHYEGCGNCGFCKTGWSQLCRWQGRMTHGYGRHGGHGDYMIAHPSTCLTLPDELSYEVGAFLACGASTAFHGLKKLATLRPRYHRHLRRRTGWSGRSNVRGRDGCKSHRRRYFRRTSGDGKSRRSMGRGRQQRRLIGRTDTGPDAWRRCRCDARGDWHPCHPSRRGTVNPHLRTLLLRGRRR